MKKEQNKKIKQLEEKVAELMAGWQRTQADFVNFKKQAVDERIKLISGAGADIIDQLLPVLDHFQLAAKHLPREL
ncbi:MAG: nucleotide exchange factor GrpE, partial [Candidatus Berkelbacteria bacterium]|nr:nucleotide exchange factor GrpE [Candidatus Berkelbacteria bacterium]